MAIIRYKPMSILQSLQDDMNRVFDQRLGIFDEDASLGATSQWNPHVDIKEKKDAYVIKADIPGVDPKDIKVSMDNNVLTIQGERQSEKEESGEGYSRKERFSGSFYRQFTLPDNVNSEAVTAKGKHGVLELTIPKMKKNPTKTIQVKSED